MKRRHSKSDGDGTITRVVLLKLIVACARDEYIAPTTRLSRFYRFVNIRAIRTRGQTRRAPNGAPAETRARARAFDRFTSY